MIADSSFSQILQCLRKREGYTQSKLADLVGVSFMTVRRWESGEIIPRVDEFKRLSETLHVTIDELLNGVKDNKVELVISWNWEDMKKGEINMEENKFKMILGGDGTVGLNGAMKVMSLADVEDFIARVRSELKIAFDTQKRRGVIPQNA